MDLSIATYAAVLARKDRRISIAWFSHLRRRYGESVDAFVACVSRTLVQLQEFVRTLPDAKEKVLSEYFEFPALARYPFLRTGDQLICWHPAVFYRGMEDLVHAVLKEQGQEYMDRFSRLFERHVVDEARRVPAVFWGEDELRALVPVGTQVPDGLLSFPGRNVFVESKAGLFDESVMTVGHSEMFKRKTRALKTALEQAWDTVVALRRNPGTPQRVRDATLSYLLIVTNKELSAGNGVALASMYPKDSLQYPCEEARALLPLEHVYIISIEDFERLVGAGAEERLDIPALLAECVQDDREPAKSGKHFFHQHLTARKIPLYTSKLVLAAIDESNTRLMDALAEHKER